MGVHFLLLLPLGVVFFLCCCKVTLEAVGRRAHETNLGAVVVKPLAVAGGLAELGGCVRRNEAPVGVGWTGRPGGGTRKIRKKDRRAAERGGGGG